MFSSVFLLLILAPCYTPGTEEARPPREIQHGYSRKYILLVDFAERFAGISYFVVQETRKFYGETSPKNPMDTKY